jgi:hypothetical protein
MTGWPADPKLREMGHLSHIAFEQDLEGLLVLVLILLTCSCADRLLTVMTGMQA